MWGDPPRASLGPWPAAITLSSPRNYGPTVFVQQEAKKKGCEQVLWLYGPDHQLTEVGTMNIFVYWTHEDGGEPARHPPAGDLLEAGGAVLAEGGSRGGWGGWRRRGRRGVRA